MLNSGISFLSTLETSNCSPHPDLDVSNNNVSNSNNVSRVKDDSTSLTSSVDDVISSIDLNDVISGFDLKGLVISQAEASISGHVDLSPIKSSKLGNLETNL